MSRNKFSIYFGYLAVSLAVLIPLQLPQVYYAYAEYDAISSILGFLPVYASTTILFNIFIMPCSWTLCFIAIAQMLDQEDLPFRKANFSKVMIGLTIVFATLTIVNTGLFYGNISCGLTSALLTHFPSYLTDASARAAWDRATALLQCCGAESAADYKQLGVVAPCASFGLGCGQTIVINFYVLWTWTLLSQIGTIAISLYGDWPKENNSIGWFDRLVEYFK